MHRRRHALIKSIILVLTLLCLLLIAGCEADTRKNNPVDKPKEEVTQVDHEKLMQQLLEDSKRTELTPGNITVTAEKGFNIYLPFEDKLGYRYGPSILINDDGSMDMWTATPGQTDQWDWIRHQRSEDGGKTWSNDVVALRPTAGAEDAYSTCDPGVIKIGKYYYIGYTSTPNFDTTCNSVYVARCEKPEGPFLEKWDGQGWSNDPKPLIKFDGNPNAWGAGEPSFVVLDDKIYIYYTWRDSVDNKAIQETRVAVAPVEDENWPGKIELKGTCIKKNSDKADSSDVKYVDDFGKFISISTDNRFTARSYIVIHQSDDGFTFSKSCTIRLNIPQFCHNAGITSRTNGHIKLSDQNYIGYAYGEGTNDICWGRWATMLNPIEVKLEDFTEDKSQKSVKTKPPARQEDPNPTISAVFCSTPVVRLPLCEERIPIYIMKIMSNESTGVVDSDIKFSNYDTSVIKANEEDFSIQPLAEGKTFITVEHSGFQDVFLVEVSKDYYYAESSSIADPLWPAYQVADGNPESCWSALGHSKGDQKPEWISIRLPEEREIKGVYLIPRWYNTVMHFPIDFKFQYSLDGRDWTDIPGQIYTNYPMPKGQAKKKFKFEESIRAKYVRIYSTEYDTYFQLAEFGVID